MQSTGQVQYRGRTRAFVRNDGVHDLRCPQDGVNRAGLNALGAANALCLANPGHDGLLFRAVFCVERLGLIIQQVSQRLNGLFSAGGALVNGIAVGDGFRIGATAGIAALATLGLGSRALIVR